MILPSTLEVCRVSSAVPLRTNRAGREMRIVAALADAPQFSGRYPVYVRALVNGELAPAIKVTGSNPFALPPGASSVIVSIVNDNWDGGGANTDVYLYDISYGAYIGELESGPSLSIHGASVAKQTAGKVWGPDAEGVYPTENPVLLAGLDESGYVKALKTVAGRLAARMFGVDGAGTVLDLPMFTVLGAPSQRLAVAETGVQLYDGTALSGAALDTGILDLTVYRELTFLVVVGVGAARVVVGNAIRDDASSVVIMSGLSTPASTTQGWPQAMQSPAENTYVVGSTVGIRGFIRRGRWTIAAAAADVRLTIWAR